MDRSHASPAQCSTAVRTNRSMSVGPVLSSGSGQCREPAIHAVNRRAILEDAVLWLTTDGRLPLAGWPSGQPQAGPTVDEADGHRRFGARTSDESQAPRTQGLSLSSARCNGPGARSHLGGRYHVCADADGVYVSGGHYRLVQSLRDGLGTLEYAGYSVLSGYSGSSAYSAEGDR